MNITKSLWGVLGISLLLMGISCNKGNPVSSNNNNDIAGTVTDADGNVYTTVKIGTQEWTVENLRVTKYNDGTAMPKVTDSVSWFTLITPEYCFYNNTTNADSIKKCGALYNWYAVNTKKLAPAGWHVPTDSEWEVMQSYLVMHGYNYDGTTDTSSNAIAMALAAKTDWDSYPGAGTPGYDLTKNDSLGFSALPVGCRINYGAFLGKGGYGGWWSASEGDSSSAWGRFLTFNDDYLGRGNSFKSSGFSVRLVKD